MPKEVDWLCNTWKILNPFCWRAARWMSQTSEFKTKRSSYHAHLTQPDAAFKLSNCGRNELLDHTEGTLSRTSNKAQGSVHSFPKDGSNDSRLFAGVPTGRRNHSRSGVCGAQRPSITEAGVTAVRRTHKEWASALGLQLPSSLVYACLMSALYALGVKLLM